MFASRSIQEAGLDSWVAPCYRISRILGRRRRVDIVLAVNPQALRHLKSVLLVYVRVRVRDFEQRS